MADEKENAMGTTWLVAGGFLLLVVVAIGAVILFPADDDNEPATPEATTGTDETTEAADDPLPTSGTPETTENEEDNQAVEPCDLDAANSDFPATVPEFRWEDHPNGVTLPVSDEHGPVVRDGDFWRCTSQTPTGAAFAGINLYSAFDAGVQEAAKDSPRARDLFEQNQELNQEANGVVRGFQITSSSETAVTIDYWMEPPNEETPLSLPLFLVWDEEVNDWRLDFSEGRPDFALIEDTSGYTEWR